jgi:hypothetical protein
MASARGWIGFSTLPRGVLFVLWPSVVVGVARREAVDLVVHDDVGQIEVAAHGVDEVGHADAVAVAVAAHRHDVQVVVGERGPGGHGQRASVQAVHTVRVDEPGQVRRAADAGDDQHVVGLDLQLDDGFLQRLEDAEIPATRTPVGIDASFEALEREFHRGHGNPFLLNAPGLR